MLKERKLIQDLPLIQPKPLSLAISALMAAPAATAMAQDQSEASSEFLLEEVIVTARKRTENLQTVPQSIQAISEQTIIDSGVRGMSDYVRFIPSLNIVEQLAGNASLVFRGVMDAQNSFIADPSAAVYLDEQSLVFSSMPNPRMVDIERVEALSGPQGTLYGASAQAGVLRIVTNKPDPTAFDANVDMSMRYMEEGEPSYDVSGMVNIPLSDSWALRLVGFTAKDGGFIDNVFGTTPLNFEQTGVTNAGAEEEDFNDVKWTGGRIAARWLMNEDWTMTAGIVHQRVNADGRSTHDPAYAGDLNVVRFKPEREWSDQDWTQYALTFEGDLGFADFVSASSYFSRDWTYQTDTSVGYMAAYFTWCYSAYPAYDPTVFTSLYCYQEAGLGSYYNSPVGYRENIQKNTKFTQEFRLVHQGETIDWVAGLYYEDSHEDYDFFTYEDNFEQSQSWENLLAGRTTQSIPTQSADNAWWFSSDSTDGEQFAVFGEMTWHITDQWDLTAGARWFKRTVDKVYFVEQPKNTTRDTQLIDGEDKDWVPKIGLSYQINDNSMVYGLYSEGFRPGASNRLRGLSAYPEEYDADKLKNWEIGTKNTFANGRVRLNATYFNMSWVDYQIELIDPAFQPCSDSHPPPCGQPWQKIVANIGNASNTGLEVQFDWAATQNFTLGVNGTWLDATLDEDVFVSVPVPKGSRLPLSPEFKGALYAQYNWPVDWFGGANNTWLRLQWSYTGDMLNQIEPLDPAESDTPQIKQPSYNIGDLIYGIDSDKWNFQLFVNNITDERAVIFANPYQFDYAFGRSRVTVNRPREFGIRWIQHFGG